MPPESSPEPEVNANAATENNQDVNSPANSSDAGQGVEKLTHLESVEAALKGEKAESPAAEIGKEKATPESTKSGGSGEGGSEDEELPEEERKLLSERAQRRFQNLTHQRDDARRQTDALKPRAEQWDRLVGYLREHDISTQEVNNALTVTRLINGGEYGKALEILTPIYRELAAKAGEVLPDDLAEDVRLGKISQERARELSRARASATAAQQREQRTTQRNAEATEQQRVAAMIDTAATTSDEWSKGKAGSDPDWHLKQDDVAGQIELELARIQREKGIEGFPKTKEAVIELCERALKVVEDRIQKLRPKPPERRAANGQFASPHSKAEPASHLDAVRQALNG